MRHALRTNARLTRIAGFSSARTRESLEEVHVIVVIAVVVEGIGRGADIAVFECQVKRIGGVFRDIRNRRDPRCGGIAGGAQWIPFLFGVMDLKSGADDGKPDEAAFVGRIRLDIRAGDHRSHGCECGHDDMNIGRGRSTYGGGIDVVPTDPQIAGRFMQEKRGFEITQWRKNRRLRRGIGLIVDGLAALLK